MAFGKKNVIKIDPLYYNLCLLGEAKSGKTSLTYQYCKKLAGDDGYLFIETGSERGADAISGINYINAPTWNMDYDEYTNSAGFADICEDIIENKTTEYPNLRVVVWDTLDHLISIAEEESIRLYNKEARAEGKPLAKTINQSWGGYGRGEKKAMDLMFDIKNRLLAVGVQTIIIGHVKKKEISDVITGETYTVLSSDQQTNYFNAFKKDLHFLALLYVDREIVKESTGKKDFRGADKKEGRMIGGTRKVKFRDDAYVLDSGSRFANIVPEIPCDVDEFIKAITDAIKAEAESDGSNIEDLEKEEKKAKAKREKEIAKAEKEEKANKELKSIVKQIGDFLEDCKLTDPSKAKPVALKARDMGYKTPLDVDSVENAKTLLELCK